MLSQSDNEFLTRSGKGTPMGELLRRFWMPALLSQELAEREASHEAQHPHDERPARRRQRAEHTAGHEQRGDEVSDRHTTILAADPARGIGQPVRQASAFRLPRIGRKGAKVSPRDYRTSARCNRGR